MPRKRGWKKAEVMKNWWAVRQTAEEVDKGSDLPSKSKGRPHNGQTIDCDNGSDLPSKSKGRPDNGQTIDCDNGSDIPSKSKGRPHNGQTIDCDNGSDLPSKSKGRPHNGQTIDCDNGSDLPSKSKGRPHNGQTIDCDNGSDLPSKSKGRPHNGQTIDCDNGSDLPSKSKGRPDKLTECKASKPYESNSSKQTQSISPKPCQSNHMRRIQSKPLKPCQNNISHQNQTSKPCQSSSSERIQVNYNWLMGTFHQGDIRFRENRGRQCVANALGSILYTYVKDIHLWNSGDLDTILTEGNELYTSIRRSQGISEIYLLVTEIPSELSLFDNTYSVSTGNSLTGILSDSFDPNFQCDFLVTLSNALRSTLSDFKSCLITFAVSTFAVIKRNRNYFVFDSHSRDNFGTQVDDGKSVLNRYGCIDEVYDHCQRLASSMNVSDNTQFEITGINIEGATEVEIFAAADLLSINIYVFSNRWLKYSWTETPLTNVGLYLKHCDQCHYEVVSDVEKHKIHLALGSLYQNELENIQTPLKPITTDTYIGIVTPGKCERERQKYWRDYKKLKRSKNDFVCRTMKAEERKRDQKMLQKRKYDIDEIYRETKKRRCVEKYATDEKHRESVKFRSVSKYAQDEKHRKSVESYSVNKYAHDDKHRDSLKSYSIVKYANDPQFKANLKKTIREKRFETQIVQRKFDNALKSCRKLAWDAPDHICSVCNRRLFAKQVLRCRNEGYSCKSARVKSLAARCISDRFVHVCSPRCPEQCIEKSSPAGKMWICYTCHRKIISGKLPAEAEVNGLYLSPIPKELNCLNSLERHLISLHIPFSKVINLRRGNQKAAHGPVVCVPSNVQGTVTALPRPECNDQLIRVKLKRKLSYKGHVDFKFVNKVRIEKALQWLIKTNKWYTGVTIDNSWANADSDVNVNAAATEHTFNEVELNELETDITDHGMYMDSCLQPVDIGQEVLDQHFDNIICLAPAEGNDPVKLLMDETNEGKSFPVLFPSGSPCNIS